MNDRHYATINAFMVERAQLRRRVNALRMALRTLIDHLEVVDDLGDEAVALSGLLLASELGT